MKNANIVTDILEKEGLIRPSYIIERKEGWKSYKSTYQPALVEYNKLLDGGKLKIDKIPKSDPTGS